MALMGTKAGGWPADCGIHVVHPIQGASETEAATSGDRCPPLVKICGIALADGSLIMLAAGVLGIRFGVDLRRGYDRGQAR